MGSPSREECNTIQPINYSSLPKKDPHYANFQEKHWRSQWHALHTLAKPFGRAEYWLCDRRNDGPVNCAIGGARPGGCGNRPRSQPLKRHPWCEVRLRRAAGRAGEGRRGELAAGHARQKSWTLGHLRQPGIECGTRRANRFDEARNKTGTGTSRRPASVRLSSLGSEPVPVLSEPLSDCLPSSASGGRLARTPSKPGLRRSARRKHSKAETGLPNSK